MDLHNVEGIVDQGMCCSCGICVSVCPQKCIVIKLNKKGLLHPVVNKDVCINCGLCIKSCSGRLEAEKVVKMKFDEIYEEQSKSIRTYVAKVLDRNILQNSTSGGIISELVNTLLNEKKYDSAFVCDTDCYEDYIKVKRYTTFDKSTAKSRYVPVSHENTVNYILNNQNERIIIVGTSCAIMGLRNMLELYHLNEENYLLIGLFCDKTMNYNIWKYFEKVYSENGKLRKLYFRTKESNGWPGDMKLEFENTSKYIPRKIRMIAKTYFMNQRCLFCTDKLNASADIAVGDNYTGKFSDINGSSSVIVRTPKGEEAFKTIEEKCILKVVNVQEICDSQKLIEKKAYYIYAQGKFKQCNVKAKKMDFSSRKKYLIKESKIFLGSQGIKFVWLLKLLMKIESLIKRGRA